MMASPARQRLMKLLIIRELVREQPMPPRRLPLGRCACQEPTVKWCGRHGQPIKEAR